MDRSVYASRLEERLSATVAAASVVWMFLVACWGINARFGDGHFASTASVGVAAENMWRHGIVYPLLYYGEGSPNSAHYYMHHPLGVYWVTALFVKVFGAHNWVLRLPAILYSTLSPLFLYRLGRALWGPLEGAIAALAFVSLPITLGFSNFHAFEGPVIFGLIVASWGYARFVQTWSSRYALASLFGFAWAVNHDFVAYVWGAVFLSWVFLRGFCLPPRAFGTVEVRAYGRYWGLMVAAALSAIVLLIALLLRTNKLPEILRMYAARSSGNSAPLSVVLQARHVWIHLMFPGLAIALGKLALPIVIGRFVVRRNDLELLPFCLLVAASFQYLHFKQGADVHIFWSQYFAPYFALAASVLVATLRNVLSWAASRARPGRGAFLRQNGAWLAAGIVTVPILFVFKDAASMVRLAQESGGRFISPHIKSDIDRVEAMRWWIPRLQPSERIAFHPGITPVHWSLNWELRPHNLMPGQPLGVRGTLPRAYAMDSRHAPSAELREAAKTFHVDAVGCFWFIDRSAPATPLTGYALDKTEPGPVAWYVNGGTEPVRTVRTDPWVTWEWRRLLDQQAVPPTAAPTTLDQIRIAHNIAVSTGDKAAAARWRGELVRRLNVPRVSAFNDGTALLGAFHSRGAERSLTLFFLTGGDGIKGRAKFTVSAKVDAPPRFSTLAHDPVVIEIAEPPPIPTDLWRPGEIYVVELSYRKRPGKERFFGAFTPLDGQPAPTPVGKSPTIDILTLP